MTEYCNKKAIEAIRKNVWVIVDVPRELKNDPVFLAEIFDAVDEYIFNLVTTYMYVGIRRELWMDHNYLDQYAPCYVKPVKS
jgi:hypothetical protein